MVTELLKIPTFLWVITKLIWSNSWKKDSFSYTVYYCMDCNQLQWRQSANHTRRGASISKERKSSFSIFAIPHTNVTWKNLKRNVRTYAQRLSISYLLHKTVAERLACKFTRKHINVFFFPRDMVWIYQSCKVESLVLYSPAVTSDLITIRWLITTSPTVHSTSWAHNFVMFFPLRDATVTNLATVWEHSLPMN